MIVSMIKQSHATSATELQLIDDKVEFSKVEAISSTRGARQYSAGSYEIDTDEEFFTIVHGKAEVIVKNGPTLFLEPGVTGYFRTGDETTWHVVEPIFMTYQKFVLNSSDKPCASSTNAATVSLDEEPMEPGQSWITSGNPNISSKILCTYHDGKVLCGIWQCTPGSVTYVEADEIFTVVMGRATVTIENGPTLELSCGVFGEFKAGDVATFHVHETFLKTFQITL